MHIHGGYIPETMPRIALTWMSYAKTNKARLTPTDGTLSVAKNILLWLVDQADRKLSPSWIDLASSLFLFRSTAEFVILFGHSPLTYPDDIESVYFYHIPITTVASILYYFIKIAFWQRRWRDCCRNRQGVYDNAKTRRHTPLGQFSLNVRPRRQKARHAGSRHPEAGPCETFRFTAQDLARNHLHSGNNRPQTVNFRVQNSQPKDTHKQLQFPSHNSRAHLAHAI